MTNTSTTLMPTGADRLAIDPLAWGYIFIADHFRQNFPDFHLELMDAAMQHRKLAIVAPREHAKSELLSFLYPLHAICFSRKRFIVMFSSTKDMAASHYSAIRIQLETNELIHAYHGKPTFKKLTSSEMIFQFPDKKPIRIDTYGAEQMESIRGLKHDGYRPDLIILDDVEFQELVDSPDRRRKLKQSFDEALIPAGDREYCQYIAIGTMLHFDALIAKLVNKDTYPDWYKMFYKTSVENPLWSDRISSKYLATVKRNNPIVYAKEYQNNPISGELARFKPDNFRYYTDQSTHYTLLGTNSEKIATYPYTDCYPAIACDLALSERKTADMSVILSLLLDPDNNYLVYSYIAERGMRPERLAHILFNQVNYLTKLTGTRPYVGFEKANIERIRKEFLQREMRRRDEFFIIKPIEWKNDKIARIELALEHLYANHVIYHRHNMTELEDQLIQFPFASHDDIPDALQGATQILKYAKRRTATSTKPSSDDPMFDWVRNNMLPATKNKSSHKKNALFNFHNNPSNPYEIKAKKSFMSR